MLWQSSVHSLPETSCRGRGYGNTSLTFLRHPIHYSSPVMYLTHLVGDTRVKQNALGCSSFTSVDVRTDSDISVTL
jgi:hypothetical protein